MMCKKSVLKTIGAMLAGALLTLAVQVVVGRWDRPAEAATIDQFARSAVANLISSLSWSGSDKIRGIAGLGDGRTFIVYTDKRIDFYQLGAVGVQPAAPVR
ncbi:hypothetical protein FJY63_15505 [Candidatus Sumerlaeota bacterium]|nr:hypothetical protein [Candidatus Sumerlaeota bacterium]